MSTIETIKTIFKDDDLIKALEENNSIDCIHFGVTVNGVKLVIDLTLQEDDD